MERTKSSKVLLSATVVWLALGCGADARRSANCNEEPVELQAACRRDLAALIGLEPPDAGREEAAAPASKPVAESRPETPLAESAERAASGATTEVADAGSEPASEPAAKSCAGCDIDGDCVASGAANPANACEVCDPARATDAWSAAVGEACDDGLYCTVSDACSAAGKCEGAARECDDGIACNGVSTCREETDDCSPPQNQCGALAICETASGMCVSTCAGCTIDGQCVASGAAQPGNPCMVCDPTRSASAYTANVGASCGAAATACSQQDSCDAQGRCQPNHLPAQTPCGDTRSSACDQADACDGNGACQQRTAANGTACDDGQFCTVGDACQGGQCVASTPRECGGGVCSEAADRCDAPLRPDGQACTGSTQCVSGICTMWFEDLDGDGFGAGTGVSVCGRNPPRGFAGASGDCCDRGGADGVRAAQIFPGQRAFFRFAHALCANVAPFDYDCSGAEESGTVTASTALASPSNEGSAAACREIPAAECQEARNFFSVGAAARCGETVGYSFCGPRFRGDTECSPLSGGSLINECH